jgi:hypothetical protein
VFPPIRGVAGDPEGMECAGGGGGGGEELKASALPFVLTCQTTSAAAAWLPLRPPVRAARANSFSEQNLSLLNM